MIKKIINWLNKPYPFITKTKVKLFISFGIGLFIFIFLLIFNPFDFRDLTNNEQFFYSLLYATITTLVILINFFGLPILFPKFANKESWKVYKEIIADFEIIIVITFLVWMLSDYSSFYNENSYYNLRFFMFATFSVGVIPLSFYIVLEERYFSKKHKQKTQFKTPNNDNKWIEINGENKKEIFQLAIDDLLFINSEKNYSSIFYFDQNKVKEKLLRISLNKIEEQLNDCDAIFRCHKSYIVNKKRIVAIKGNSRGYRLTINGYTSKEIPVSRKFSKRELIKLLD